MNGSSAEDKRFEAALRLFVVQINNNLATENQCTPEELRQQAEGAVLAADALLTALRREKP